MKKKYVCSIFMKIVLFLLEVLFVFGTITELSRNNILIGSTYIIGYALWILFDYVLLSIIMIDNEKIKIFNKFKFVKLDYFNISKVQIIENGRIAFLFGSTFDFVFTMKDDKIFKFHVGQIFRANEFKKDMQRLFRLKCIKLEEKDYYKK